MKSKRIFSRTFAGVLILLFFTSVGNTAILFLPKPLPQPVPGTECNVYLPYKAKQDNYGGAACVQMTLNGCPNTAGRSCIDQQAIFNSINAHSVEQGLWITGDPKGIEGALEDPLFAPCGNPLFYNWVTYFSSTDKMHTLRKMVYWMYEEEYLTPVLIGGMEYWVAVCGYWTKGGDPSPNGPVTLWFIFFYDPFLESDHQQHWPSIVVGQTWLNNPEYWGVPLDKPGSSWHNKYVAVIEPPEQEPELIIPEWILEGPILPVEEIEEHYYEWLEEVRRDEITRGPLEVLEEDIRIKEPILVETPKYSYYLIPFMDYPLGAIFNAYDGSFEEFSYFPEAQKFVAEPDTVVWMIRQKVRAYKAEVVEISTPGLKYDAELAPVGRRRFSPVWKTEASVRTRDGELLKLEISVNTGGEVVRGLEPLREEKPEGPDTCCVRFDDLPLGKVYHVGDVFSDRCARITVEKYQLKKGSCLGLVPAQWASDGSATIVNTGMAGGSGKEIEVNNVNLDFDFIVGPCKGLTLLFGEYGGSVNIEINGDFRNIENFADINGKTIGGVNVSVVNGFGNDNGTLRLVGTVKSFAIGGQELWIDDVCCEK